MSYQTCKKMLGSGQTTRPDRFGRFSHPSVRQTSAMAGRGRGRGRGRELTRPAWMKAEGIAPSLPKPANATPTVNDWQTATSATGRTYWYSLSSGKTTWDDPTKAAAPKAATLTIDEWKEHKTAEGRPYFFNARTRETRWERPAPATAQPAPTPDASSTPAASALPAGWAENKAADGRVYYYHSVTRKTQWTRPSAVVSSAPAASAESAQPQATSSATGLPAGWAEFRAPDGRPYFYHKATSKTSWTNPAIDNAQTGASSVMPGNDPSASKRPRGSETEPPRKAARNLRRPREEDGTPMRNRAAEKWLLARAKKRRASRAERAAADGTDVKDDDGENKGPTDEELSKMTLWEKKQLFTKLLEDHGVRSTSTWLQGMDRCVEDPRYEILSTYGERKSAFHAYVQRLQSEQRRTEIVDSLAVNEAYWKFLETTLRDEPMCRRSLEDCRQDVVKRVKESAEYRAVTSDSTRYGLTRAFFDQRQRALERERASKRKRLLTRVRLVLDAMTDPSIRPTPPDAMEVDVEAKEEVGEFSSPWLNGRSSIREVDRRLTSLAEFRDLKPKEIQIVYGDWIRDVDKLVDEKRIRERDARRAMLRGNRAKFRTGVLAMMLDGRVGVRAGWKDVAHAVGNEAFAAPESELGERPVNLFRDAREMFEERVQGEKDKFKELLKEADVTISEETTEEQLRASEKINAFFSSLQKSVVEALILDRKRKEHRRKENAFGDFEQMLRELVRRDEIKLDATYDSVGEKIGGMEPTKRLVELVGVESVKGTFEKLLERRRAREERRVKRRLDEPGGGSAEKRPRTEGINGMQGERVRVREEDTGWAAAVEAKPLSAEEKAAEKERRKRALLATLGGGTGGRRGSGSTPSGRDTGGANGAGAIALTNPASTETQAGGKDAASSAQDERKQEAMIAK